MSDAMGYFEFADRVRLQNRFLLDQGSRLFLERLAQEAESRAVHIQPDETYWRAQINLFHDLQEVSPDADPMPVPLSKDRMLPLAELVGDGRINPRGIAYLYVATSEATAIAEVRPPRGSHVTVAEVSLTQPAKVVDCRAQSGTAHMWADLDFAFAFPADGVASWRSYLPTQCIAEFFKLQGYDGIKYRSALSEDGHNLAIFDPTRANIGTRRLFTIDAIRYEYRPDQLFPEDSGE